MKIFFAAVAAWAASLPFVPGGHIALLTVVLVTALPVVGQLWRSR